MSFKSQFQTAVNDSIRKGIEDRPTIDPLIHGTLKQLRRTMYEAFEPNKIKNQNKFMGVCLQQMLNVQVKNSKKIRIKARIPEIHSLIPIPEDKEDYLYMSFYPTYVGELKDLNMAAGHIIPVGARVELTYGNTANFGDPTIVKVFDTKPGTINPGSTEEQDGAPRIVRPTPNPSGRWRCGVTSATPACKMRAESRDPVTKERRVISQRKKGKGRHNVFKTVNEIVADSSWLDNSGLPDKTLAFGKTKIECYRSTGEKAPGGAQKLWLSSNPAVHNAFVEWILDMVARGAQITNAGGIRPFTKNNTLCRLTCRSFHTVGRAWDMNIYTSTFSAKLPLSYGSNKNKYVRASVAIEQARKLFKEDSSRPIGLAYAVTLRGNGNSTSDIAAYEKSRSDDRGGQWDVWAITEWSKPGLNSKQKLHLPLVGNADPSNYVSKGRIKGFDTVEVEAFNITTLAKNHGIEPIPCIDGYRMGKSGFMKNEWWHWQAIGDMVSGETTFGTDLLYIYDEEVLKEDWGPNWECYKTSTFYKNPNGGTSWYQR